MFWQIALLLGAAGLCALLSNALAGPSRHLPWLGRPAVADPARTDAALHGALPAPAQPPPDPARFAADPSQPIRDLQPEEAWALFQARAPFLDARRSDEFKRGHVAGAWNISVWESSPDARITEFEAAAAPASSAPLVLYCSGGDCEDSHLLASRLAALGYRNLLIYRAGYPDWEKRGYPITRGDKP